MLRRRQFFSGTPAHQGDRDDLDWYRPDGSPMAPTKTGAKPTRGPSPWRSAGRPPEDDALPDDPFLALFNAWWEPLDSTVPDPLRSLAWLIEVDTNDPSAAGRAVDPSAAVPITGRSLMLLRSTQPAS